MNRIRRLMALLCALCILAGASFVFAEDAVRMSDTSQRYEKIGILYGNSAATEVKLDSDGGFVVANIASDGWHGTDYYPNIKTLYVKNENSVLRLVSADGSVNMTIDENKAVMAASKDHDNAYISINGTKYRDGAAFKADGNLITVMSYVCVEHYLWGVVSSEVSYLYPLEALKAQAVCARSFVYANGKKHAARGFDLCNTSCCQVYKPVNLEYPSIIRACRETENIVITSKGKVVIGYYYANSGGYTMNSEDVWIGYVAHARAKEDIYSPASSWSFSYSFDQIQQMLEASNYRLGKLQSVQITKRTDYGAVLEMTFTGSNGSLTLSKSSIKTLLKLKSQIFSIGSTEDFEPMSVGPKNEEAEKPEENNDIYVLGADGTLVKKNRNELVILGAEGTASGADAAWNGFYKEGPADIDAPVTDGIVYFKGAGSGHGVGMSQTGARAMAQKGKTYEEILNYYFTDIVLKTYER